MASGTPIERTPSDEVLTQTASAAATPIHTAIAAKAARQYPLPNIEAPPQRLQRNSSRTSLVSGRNFVNPVAG